MTTIVAIKTNSGPDAVVFASDTQLNYHNEDGEVSTKQDIYKIFIGNHWAMADAGRYDKDVIAFYSYLRGKKPQKNFLKALQTDGLDMKVLADPRIMASADAIRRAGELKEGKGRKGIILETELMTSKSKAPLPVHMKNEVDRLAGYEIDPVKRAIQLKRFEEVLLLNIAYQVKEPGGEEMSEFVLASNHPEVELYKVSSLGHVTTAGMDKRIDYFTIGSGSTHVQSFIDDEKFTRSSGDFPAVEVDSITIENAINIASRSMMAAYEDVYSGGPFDLVVIRKNSIDEHGRKIRQRMQKSRDGLMQEIMGKYRDKGEPEGSLS